MEFDLENPLMDMEEHKFDVVSALFAAESDHMPSFTAFDSTDVRKTVRRHCIDLVSQAQSSYNFDGCIAYLAVNYIDRFISKQVVMVNNKPWIVRILVIASLSLAAKMRNIDLSLSDIQSDIGSSFDVQSIHRMEAMILTELQWRLRSITPFSFLNFFLSLFQLCDDSPLTQALKQRASDIIFSTQYEIKFFEYKPSIIAALAVVCAADELIPLQFSSSLAAISQCQYLNKEELESGLTVMREKLIEGAASTDEESGSTLTPTSVLECESTSSESESTPTYPDGNNMKRRRLNDIRDD